MIDKGTIHVKKGENGEPTSIEAVEDGVNISIPFDPKNRHFYEIMQKAKKEPKIISFDFKRYDKP